MDAQDRARDAAVLIAHQNVQSAMQAGDTAASEEARSVGISRFGKMRIPGGPGESRRGTLSGTHEIELRFGDLSTRLPAGFRFLPCGQTVRAQPEDAEGERLLEDRPLHWVFDDAKRRIVVRFSVDGVVAMAADEAAGCVREGDLTEHFVGAPVADAEALFAPSGLPYLDGESSGAAQVDSEETPQAVASAAGFSWTLDRRELEVTQGDSPLLTARYALDELRDWTVRAGVVEGKWFRLVVDGEREIKGDDAVAGRRDMIVWPLEDGGLGEAVFNRQWISGEEGAERSDDRITLMRRIVVGEAEIVMQATRRQGDRPLMLGAGKCPEMEGLTDVIWSDTIVRWTLHHGGQKQNLGSSACWDLATAGCLAAVKGEVGRGKTILSDRIAARPVTYELND